MARPKGNDSATRLGEELDGDGLPFPDKDTLDAWQREALTEPRTPRIGLTWLQGCAGRWSWNGAGRPIQNYLPA